MRVEDIDTPRVVAGSAARILDDTRWLGLSWEEPIIVQSERTDLYRAALDRLRERGLVYPCDCSRQEIQRVASAPHAGEEIVYPGTCRDADPNRTFKRDPALRVRVPAGERIAIVDGLAGPFSQVLDRDVGDFVLVRGDGVFAYQLAVVVDDLAMGLTDVIRGMDLLSSTPRQLWLARQLGATDEEIPRYAHLPLVVDHQGNRIQKRTPGAHVRALREAGVRAEAIVGVLAYALGVTSSDAPISVDALRLPRERAGGVMRGMTPRPLRVPEAWAHVGPSDPQRVRSDK